MGFLRLLLAMSVVVQHVSAGDGFLLPGNIAVEVFFMISGFYMSLIMTEKYDPRTGHGITNFYFSRYLRLWPTFLITTLAVYAWSLIAHAYLGHDPTGTAALHRDLGRGVGPALLTLSNIFMIGQDVPSLFHVHPGGGAFLTFGPPSTLPDGSLWLGFIRNIGQAWSIGTEIWFYLLVPFLVRLSSRWLIALALVSGLVRLVMASKFGLNVYFFFPTQLLLFIAGMLAYRLGRLPAPARNWAAGICLVSMIVCALGFGSLIGINQDFKWLLYALTAATMNSLFAVSKNVVFDRLIGELSYPIYIIHTFLLAVAATVVKHLGLPEVFGTWLMPIAVIPCAFLLFRYVETPVNKFRERFAKPENTLPAPPEPVIFPASP